ncbi:TPA: MarR family transcriptional regulator [Clostridioides difficile]|uniref:MarR family winged helix-turn-helix transcriptional regulator n=1 Tax=Clostridioides difficile TaxID=1496 RepID=UPI00038D6896|nr:MarR family transcriptional regulator [Clostridioides difficile]EQE85547.1 marR family protein [Clostridioides difficile CD69]HBF7937297.1 MarR family transcriptional regulator [Clostridioides difficile]HBG6490622.1 MarR family transcriptional regulator [Clostridioides difficile]
MDEMSFKKELLELTRDINMKFTTLLSDFYQPLGITAVQALILSELCEHGEKKISDLGKNLNMKNSNVSVICQRLEKNGFLNRIRDIEDQRIVKVKVTNKSLDIQEHISSSIFDSYFENMTSEKLQDMEDIIEGLEKLNKLLTYIDCK